MKKINFIIISALFIMINTLNVKALEDKTLEIFLPANAISNNNCQNNLTSREIIVLNVFENGDTIINDRGKDIIEEVYSETENTVYFKVLPEVTVEDRTIEITQELIDIIKRSTMKTDHNYVGNNKNNQIIVQPLINTYAKSKAIAVQEPAPSIDSPIKEDFEEIVKGYTKIRFTVKNIECKPITEKVIYDFKMNPSILDLSVNSNEILTNLLNKITISSNSYPIAIRNNSDGLNEIVNNYNGKTLFYIGPLLTEFRLVSGLTYEDNITIKLQEVDYLEYENHLIKEIEFRFGDEPVTKDEVIQVPNTSKMNPAYICLLSLSLIGVGSIIVYDINKKKTDNN